MTGAMPHMPRFAVPLAFAIGGLVVLAGAVCRSAADNPATSPEGAARTPVRTSQSIGVFDQFPLVAFDSIDAAERRAGFQIPQPSAEFPMAFHKTYLRGFPDGSIASTTQYTYAPLAPDSIGVTVYPATPEEAASLAHGGSPATFGDHTGRLSTDDGAWSFDYQCGSFGGEPLWCSVLTSQDIPAEAFSTFVSSLR